MRRPAAVSTIALALGAMMLAPRPGAQAQDAREGPREIEKCQTISKPGSYKLVNDLTFTGTGICLDITANFVTIDLAGFSINGPGGDPVRPTTAIAAGNDSKGIAVRNGSISGFFDGVTLGGEGSIVEGLRVFGTRCPCEFGIIAKGIVRSNTTVGIAGEPVSGIGISATGTVTGNYATGSRFSGIDIGQGSTVIGNTAIDNRFGPGPGIGISVNFPSNVTDNTAINNNQNLVLNGTGCNDTNNVAP